MVKTGLENSIREGFWDIGKEFRRIWGFFVLILFLIEPKEKVSD